MPLPSYTWVHPQARVSPSDREALMDFFSVLMPGGMSEREEH